MNENISNELKFIKLFILQIINRLIEVKTEKSVTHDEIYMCFITKLQVRKLNES